MAKRQQARVEKAMTALSDAVGSREAMECVARLLRVRSRLWRSRAGVVVRGGGSMGWDDWMEVALIWEAGMQASVGLRDGGGRFE